MAKKILVCTQATCLNSGYSVYGKELLSRLHKNNSFHVAEFASNLYVEHPGIKDIEWKVYPNAVRPEDSRYQQFVQSGGENSSWRYEKVLLHFRPDIVIGYKDYWMMRYQYDSLLRPYYHNIFMAPVDSKPQNKLWLEGFMN